MNILVDIGHPAHVHYYRILINELRERGHKITVTVKNVTLIKELLDFYKIDYVIIGSKGRGISGKIFKQFIFDLKLFRLGKREKIDLALGTSISITHLTFLSGIPSIFFEDDDDDVIPLSVRFGHPFASVIAAPGCLKGKKKGKNVIFYPGYHELAYLHPNRFIPDRKVVDELGIKEGEKYFIMRFSALDAHHDTGIKGITKEMKLRLIDILTKHGRVFITSEKNIEPELEAYRLVSEPHKIHSLMYFCHIFIGDSQTMSSEAAVLGVPSLRCNSFAGRISYLQEQEEKYGLTYAFNPEEFKELLEKLKELLQDKRLKERWREKRDRMLNDTIDVTPFWRWLIESYPGSVKKMKEDPAFPDRFKHLQS